MDVFDDEDGGRGGCSLASMGDEFESDMGASGDTPPTHAQQQQALQQAQQQYLKTQMQQRQMMGAAASLPAAVPASAVAYGAAVVETLSGPQLNSASGTRAVTSAAASPPGRRTLNVTYQLKGSLADFAAGTVVPELALTEGAKDFFAGGEHHVFYGARIVKVRNEHPVAFHINADDMIDEHVDDGGAKTITSVSQSVADNGSGTKCSGSHLVQAGETATYGEKGIAFLRGSGEEVDAKPFVQKFPERNLSNVQEGIQFARDDSGELALVAFGHPVTVYFNAIRRSQGEPELDESDLIANTRSFNADAENVRQCLANLEAKMRSNTVDMHDFKFGVTRVFGDVAVGDTAPKFDDTKELESVFGAPATMKAALKKEKTLSVTVAYDFRPS